MRARLRRAAAVAATAAAVSATGGIAARGEPSPPPIELRSAVVQQLDARLVQRIDRALAEHRQLLAIDASLDAWIPPRTVWDRLADCESGRWDRRGRPIPGTARWDDGISRRSFYEGGLHFHPQTWERFRDPDMPAHAGAATREQQIRVAERVLDAQGWRAWPVCSRKLRLRR